MAAILRLPALVAIMIGDPGLATEVATYGAGFRGGSGGKRLVTIAIVEDNPRDRDVLADYLQRAASSGDFGPDLRPEDLRILSYADGEAFVEGRPERVDIALLDIEMEPLNGIEAARRIRAFDDDMVIVFVTNLFQFALEGYEVQALDFIVKPVRYQGFVTVMSRALQTIERRRPHYIRLEFGRSQSLVDVASITYVETQRKRLMVHTRGGVDHCASSLKALAEKLEPYGFAMPHQSYLVNLAYVERIDALSTVVAGDAVPISRHKRAAFTQAFATYIGRML